MPTRPRRLYLLFLLLLPLAGCAHPVTGIRSEPAVEIQWPNRPFEPRVKWVKSVTDPAGAGIAKSFWSRALDLFSGADRRHIVRPYGVLLDGKDRLVVADPGAGAVHVFDGGSNRYTMITQGANGPFRTPLGVAADREGRLYISDSTSGEITRYDIATGQVSSLQLPPLSRPTGLAYNRVNGLLYIVDTLADEVVAVDPEKGGGERLRFGSSFNHPTDICADAKGQLYVTDPLNHSIKIFTPEGRLVGQIGRAGDELGGLNKPKGVAVDSEGHIYVADAMHDAIQVFDPQGRFLLSFGSTGSGDGQLWMPSGIFMDRDDYLAVSDTYNRRVQVFRYLGQPKGGRSPIANKE